MKRIIVNIICDLSRIPNLEAILPHEFEAARQLKEKGVLEHVFTKSDESGAVLVFKEVEESQVKQYVADFPLAPYFGTVVYFATEKHF